MKPDDKVKVTVEILRPIPPEILKKYGSPKPVRYRPPRLPKGQGSSS